MMIKRLSLNKIYLFIFFLLTMIPFLHTFYVCFSPLISIFNAQNTVKISLSAADFWNSLGNVGSYYSNNFNLIPFYKVFSLFVGSEFSYNEIYMYLHGVLNYEVIISIIYFFFELVIWFINYARKLLYAFENKGGAE